MRAWATLVALFCLAAPRIADACGGCISHRDAPSPPPMPGVPPPPPVRRSETPQVVTDHRMVLSLSTVQTTLWDQIRYAGDPADFVWVLPVANARDVQIGVGNNNFIDALDRLSTPQFTALVPQCGGLRTTSGSGGSFGGSGFGCGGSTAPAPDRPTIEYMQEFVDGGAVPASESAAVGPFSALTVGPYAISIVDASPDPGAILTWLDANGYHPPATTRGILERYMEQRFDYIVVRLRPDVGTQIMQPIRVTMRGYQPVLPLRMVAAGVSDTVTLTLMVMAASDMVPSNFRSYRLDASALTWDATARRSNYRELFLSQTLNAPVAGFVSETVQNVFESIMDYPGTDAGADSGVDAAVQDPSSDDGGLTNPLPDMDASLDSGLDASGSADSGTIVGPDGGPMLPPPDPYVDRRIAFVGLSGRAILSRHRAVLRVGDLDRDLQLESTSTRLRSQLFQVATIINQPPCPDAGFPSTTFPQPRDAGTAPVYYGSGRGCFCGTAAGRSGWRGAVVLGLTLATVTTLRVRSRRRRHKNGEPAPYDRK